MYATRTMSPKDLTVHLLSADASPVPRPFVDALSNCARVERLEVHRDLSLGKIDSWPRGVRVVYVPDHFSTAFAGAASELTDCENSPLIVASELPELAITAFEVGAVDFLVPPLSEARVLEAILRCAARVRPAEQVLEGLLGSLHAACRRDRFRGDFIVCRTPTTVQLVPIGDVRWIEGNRNYINVHSGAGIVRKRGSLNRLESQLPEHFRRVHRSAIVNMNKVIRIDRFPNATGQAVLDDGSKVPISRGRKLYDIAPSLAESF